MAELGPEISKQLEKGGHVKVKVPFARPSMTLQADSENPGQLKFLRLAVKIASIFTAKEVLKYAFPLCH